jgi:hypothetical protein
MKRKLFQDTVARPMIGGRWALMNRQETGLASSAIEYKTLDKLTADWDVTLGEIGEDKFGEFVRVLRNPVVSR